MDDEKKVLPISVDDFIALEFARLVYAINQTDPRGRDYAQLLENIDRFAATAYNLPEIWDRVVACYERQGKEFPKTSPMAEDGKEPELIKPFPAAPVEETPAEEEKPAPKPKKKKAKPEVAEEPQAEPEAAEEPQAETEQEAPVYDAVTVKQLIGRARADGKLDSIKGWLVKEFGVEGFAALPATRYGEAVEKLKTLGVKV